MWRFCLPQAIILCTIPAMRLMPANACSATLQERLVGLRPVCALYSSLASSASLALPLLLSLLAFPPLGLIMITAEVTSLGKVFRSTS